MKEPRISEFERDGFCKFSGLLDPALVAKARAEVDSLFDRDLEERRISGNQDYYNTGVAGRTHLIPEQHTMFEAFGKSPALDAIFDFIFSDPLTVSVAEHAGGKFQKMRGYNIRRMTGAPDPMGMEYHRDNTGEMTWLLILTDIESMDDAATGLIPGSHRFPYCPWKNTLMPMRQYAGVKLFTRWNVFGNLMRRRIKRTATSTAGKAGDFCLMGADVWHSRTPNVRGKKSIVVLVGMFPSEIEFPPHGGPSEATPEVMQRLPASVQARFAHANMPANDKTSYFYRMMDERLSMGVVSLWRFAYLERRISDAVSPFLIKVFGPAANMIAKAAQSMKSSAKDVLRPVVKPLLDRMRPSARKPA